MEGQEQQGLLEIVGWDLLDDVEHVLVRSLPQEKGVRGLDCFTASEVLLLAEDFALHKVDGIYESLPSLTLSSALQINDMCLLP